MLAGGLCPCRDARLGNDGGETLTLFRGGALHFDNARQDHCKVQREKASLFLAENCMQSTTATLPPPPALAGQAVPGFSPGIFLLHPYRKDGAGA